MKPKYELSASEDEVEEKPDITQNDVTQSSPSLQDSDSFQDILARDNLVKFDFNQLNRVNTLFTDSIDEDDEIWHLQCPKEVGLSSLQTGHLNLESPVSRMKCKVGNKKKKYTVYSFPKTEASRTNLALPNSKIKSFQIKSLPLAGRLVLQEIVSIKTKDNTEIKSE